MLGSDAQTSAIPPAQFKTNARRDTPAQLVVDEPRWRSPPDSVAAPSASRVTAMRWRVLDDRVREVSAETPGDCHVIAIVLRRMNCRFSVAGRVVQDGIAAA